MDKGRFKEPTSTEKYYDSLKTSAKLGMAGGNSPEQVPARPVQYCVRCGGTAEEKSHRRDGAVDCPRCGATYWVDHLSEVDLDDGLISEDCLDWVSKEDEPPGQISEAKYKLRTRTDD